MGEHDDETTLTMLERKTAELRASVNKDGWDSVAASHSPNIELRRGGPDNNKQPADPPSPGVIGSTK